MKLHYLILAVLPTLMSSYCDISSFESNSESEVISESVDSTLSQESSSSFDSSTEEVSSSEQIKEDELLNNLKPIFGEDIKFYTAEETNPYNIDIRKYGYDVKVIFYEDKIDETTDPYTSVNKSSFYETYSKATSYEDSYYRTLHGLMSGDITPADYLPVSLKIQDNDKYVRYSTATYVLSPKGEYIAYVENNFDEFNVIYYNGGYASLDEVAAHILAFGEVPANSNYHKSKGKGEAVSVWGEFGRVNHSVFSGNVEKYPYEPLLPTITTTTFHETDFGAQGNYTLKNDDLGTTYNQVPYNDGRSITRGAARIVFTYDSKITRIDDRYVFYTYNHYNDFQEYLNYHHGWGERFGNESAGNGYCYNNKDYYASNKYPVSKYPETIIKEFNKGRGC